MSERVDSPITTENIVVFGFGAQGRAQALNLQDCKATVSVHLREGSPRIKEAADAGIQIITDPAEAASRADLAVMLLPDSAQPGFYRKHLRENLAPGAALLFAHGYAIHYGKIDPRDDIDVLLAAPLGHANALREGFKGRGGVPFVVAVHQDATGRAWLRAKGYAEAVGGRPKIIESTFAEEVETDLFAEQAVLCGGMPELVRAAFDTLVDGGYNPDIAYFCCLRELQPIVDIMARESIAGMRRRISDTAQFGSVTRGPAIINDEVKKSLVRALDEIRSGEFDRELSEDQARGFERLKTAARSDCAHRIEALHRKHAEADSGE